MSSPSIDHVKEIQARLGISDHVIYIGATGFVLAHTDSERESGMNLEDCSLHTWMRDEHNYWDPEMKTGYYRVTSTPHDPISESFRSHPRPFVFEPLDVAE